MRQIVLILTLSLSASAAILFEVPAPPAITYAQYFGPFPGIPYRQYMAFSVSQDSVLESISILFGYNSAAGLSPFVPPPSDSFVVDLYSDNGAANPLPGTFIDTLFGAWPWFTFTMQQTTMLREYATATAVRPIYLTANTLYWIRPSSTVATVYGGWAYNMDYTALLAESYLTNPPYGPCSNCTSPVMRAEGSPIPEPSTFLLLLALCGSPLIRKAIRLY